MANFRPGSRYTNGTFTNTEDNKSFLLLRNRLEVPESGQDIFLTVEGRHLKRPDLIASDTYKRVELFWVIMDINNIRQPLFDLRVGQQIRIPPLNNVLEAIEKLNAEG